MMQVSTSVRSRYGVQGMLPPAPEFPAETFRRQVNSR